MMLKSSRCFNHATREAVARCLRCGRFFCRECIIEHEGKVICSRCLEQKEDKRGSGKFRSMVSLLFKSLLGFFIAWLMFYYLGRGLMLIPTDFHDGTIWDTETFDE